MRIGKPKRIIEVEPGELDSAPPAAPSQPDRRAVPDEDETRREKKRVPQKK